jgi:hypothetical protein
MQVNSSIQGVSLSPLWIGESFSDYPAAEMAEPRQEMGLLKLRSGIATLLLLVAPLALAQQKPKKHSDLPAVFSKARFVFVQAEDGDIMRPGLYPEDRNAISDVQQGIRDWNRYAVAINRDDADLILIVRKGRIAGAQGRVGVSGGSPRQPGVPFPGSDPRQDGIGTSVGAAGEVGPPDDMLRVYTHTPDGKLTGPLWSREMKDGLDAPSVLLLQQLKQAVEHAYPPVPPSPQPTQKPKP